MQTGKGWLQDLMRSYVFLTRLPLTRSDDDLPSRPISQSMRGFPVIGALIGAMGGIAYLLGDLIGLTPLLSASLGVLVLTALTGAMHEQALVNITGMANSAAPGMKGIVFVVLLLLIKIACLVQVGSLNRGAPLVVILLISASSVARAAMVGAAYFLQGQPDGADSGGNPENGACAAVPQTQFMQAIIIAALVVTLCLALGQGFSIAIASILAAILAGAALTTWMNSDIMQPADALGAVIPVSETAFLLTATALLAQ